MNLPDIVAISHTNFKRKSPVTAEKYSGTHPAAAEVLISALRAVLSESVQAEVIRLQRCLFLRVCRVDLIGKRGALAELGQKVPDARLDVLHLRVALFFLFQCLRQIFHADVVFRGCGLLCLGKLRKFIDGALVGAFQPAGRYTPPP